MFKVQNLLGLGRLEEAVTAAKTSGRSAKTRGWLTTSKAWHSAVSGTPNWRPLFSNG